MYMPHFKKPIHPSIHGYLDHFYLLATMKNCHLNNRYTIVSSRLRIYFGYEPEVGLLDHMVILFFKFFEKPPYFFI